MDGVSPLSADQLSRAFSRAHVAFVLVASAIAACALTGAVAGAGVLRSWASGAPPMAPATAIGLLALAAATQRLGAGRRAQARALAAAVLAGTAANAVRVMLDGRLAPLTILLFALVCGAVLVDGRAVRGRDVATGAAALAAMLSLFVLLAYGSGIDRLFGVDPVAAPTAVAFLALAAAAIAARRGSALMRLLTAGDAGGVVVRRLLPLAIGLPLVLDAVRLGFAQARLGDERTADWLYAFLVLALLTLVVLRLGAALQLAERRRRATEDRLRASESLSRAIFDTASDAIVCFGHDGRITRFNRAAEQLLGWPAGEAVGRAFTALLPERHHAVAAAAREVRTVEVQALRHDGGEVDVELSLGAFQQGEQQGHTAILRDITGRKRLEEVLRVDAERLGRVVAAQTSIVSAGGSGGELLEVVAQRAADLVGADGAVVEMPDGDELVYRAAVGAAAGHYGLRVRAGGSLSGEALRTGLTLHCADTEQDARVDRDACRRIGIRSMICVPLRHRHDVVGVLKVLSARAHAFAERDERTLELLAGLMGSSLHRSRVEGRLAAHHAVSHALAQADGLEHGLTAMLHGVAAQLGLDAGAVFLRTPDQRGIACAAVWHDPQLPAAPFADACRDTPAVSAAGLARRVWGSCLSAWVEDPPAGDEDPLLRAAAAIGLRTLACVPIVSHGEALGAITFGTRERHPSDTGTLALLEGLAAQAGQFVQRNRAEERIARQAANLAAVVGLGREVSRLRDPAVVRPLLVRAIAEIADAPQVMLLEPRGGDRLVATAMHGHHLPEGLSLPLDQPSLAAEVFASGRGRFAGDGQQAPGAAHQLARDSGLHAAHVEPVLRDGLPVGVLHVAWAEPRRHDPHGTGALVALLAAEVASVIERSDLVAALDATARTDQLTGVPNRRAWDEELPRELARAGRAGTALSVAVIDLDHFKAYNDEHGHPAGDRLLREATAAWSARLRTTDLLARYGGEEFAVLLPGHPGRRGARRAAHGDAGRHVVLDRRRGVGRPGAARGGGRARRRRALRGQARRSRPRGRRAAARAAPRGLATPR